MRRKGSGCLVDQALPRRAALIASSPQSSNAPHLLSQPSPRTSSPQERGWDSARAQGTSLPSPLPKKLYMEEKENSFASRSLETKRGGGEGRRAHGLRETLSLFAFKSTNTPRPMRVGSSPLKASENGFSVTSKTERELQAPTYELALQET